ncbi:MAG TPA: molecular chaperone DnaJ [Actinomycetota bacterium]|nr:molecular chaperone DnaJ [Actinomycetota bacterium]
MSVNRDWLEKDYYAVLGVAKNASHQEIRKAYRGLAQKLHPDANPGDRAAEERFKELSAAYDVLGDVKKRKEYDRVREMAGSGFGFGVGGPGGARVRFEDMGFEESFGDLFNLFGGGFGGPAGPRARRRTVRRKGADLDANVRVTFEEAAMGTTVPVQVSGAAPCDTCGGTGAAPGTQVKTCPECLGTGQVAVDQGLFSLNRTCGICGGSGRLIESPCQICGGSGRTRSSRSFKVKIPPGVEDGARIRVSGRGDPGPPGGEPGDLYVVVHVAPHRIFGRNGLNLTLSLPLTFPEAALGADVKVPTLNGTVTLRIPPGTDSGKTFRLRSHGVSKPGGGRGDLLVTVSVEVPKRLSKRERELLEQFREAHTESPRPGMGTES